jgi:hypothetical protein
LPRATPDSAPDLGNDFLSGDAMPAVTKLEIGPACAHLEVGRTFAFKAWGTTLGDSRIDVTAQVDWVSAKPGVATFSATTPGVATAVAAGDFDISVSGWGLTATLPARVAAWATTKLDYDVAPKDFHVMTTSLGATPDRAGLAVAAWLVPDSASRMGVSYREYDPAAATWYRGRKTEAFCTTPTHPSFVEALVLGRRKLRPKLPSEQVQPTALPSISGGIVSDSVMPSS